MIKELIIDHKTNESKRNNTNEIHLIKFFLAFIIIMFLELKKKKKEKLNNVNVIGYRITNVNEMMKRRKKGKEKKKM